MNTGNNFVFQAGGNVNLSLKLIDFSPLLSAKKLEGPPLLPVNELKNRIVTNIPKEFDAHKQWPYCHYIGEVYYQGAFSSCWISIV